MGVREEVKLIFGSEDQVSGNANKIMGALKGLALGYGAVEAARKGWELAEEAARAEDVTRAYKNLATAAGVDATNALNKMKVATAGTISEMKLMQQFNTAAMLGLPIERFDEMLQIARSASLSTGQSMEFMLNSIVTGIGRQSRLMLDNLGIIVSAEDAYSQYADEVGKAASELTALEQKQAFANLALEKGLDIVERTGGAGGLEAASDVFSKLKSEFADLQIEIGKALMPTESALTQAAVAIVRGLKDAVEEERQKEGPGFWEGLFTEPVRIAVEFRAAADRFEADERLAGAATRAGTGGYGIAGFGNEPMPAPNPEFVPGLSVDDLNRMRVESQQGPDIGASPLPGGGLGALDADGGLDSFFEEALAKHDEFNLAVAERETEAGNQLLAQYTDRFGSEASELEAWYITQQELFAGNQEALNMIEELYGDQRVEMRRQQDRAVMSSARTLFGSLASLAKQGGKSNFGLYQGLAIGETIIATHLAATKAMASSAPPMSFILAAAAMAKGLASVSAISSQRPPQAHAGAEYIPEQSTYLLQRGERVLAPEQNRDLTEFMQGGGGVTISGVSIQVPDGKGLLEMTDSDWDNALSDGLGAAVERRAAAGLLDIPLSQLVSE